MKILVPLFSLLIFITQAFADVESGRRYAINQPMAVQNGSSASGQQTLRPDQNLTFEIVGEGSWYYNLKVFGPDGEEIQGNFISSRANIDNAFVLADVMNTYDEAMAALENVQNCPACQSRAQGVEPETRPVAVGSGEVCAHYSKFIEAGVPEEPLKQALLFYQENRDEFEDGRYVSIADYSVNSREERFYILDMETGEVRKEKVSHGSGDAGGGRKSGDQNHDGMIDGCHHGNDINNRTNMTRAGFFRTKGLYASAKHSAISTTCGRQKKWPDLDSRGNNGMRMDGLTPGVNDEALSRGVVMHGAWYNSCAETMGRSYGCPAFEPDVAGEVINTIKEGNLYYSYTPVCEELHSMVEEQVQGWEGMCE